MLRSALGRVFRRQIRSISNYEQETANYKKRKDLIQERKNEFYPPINKIRTANVPRMRIEEFRRRFGTEEFDKYQNKRFPQVFCLEGRVASIRKAGKAMYFIDLIQDDQKVQLMASNKLMDMTKEDFDMEHSFLRRGDHISCVGHPSKTQVGELSLKLAEKIKLATPCLRLATLPEKLVDKSLINSNRVLDYLVSSQLRQRLMIKSCIIQALRLYFIRNEFMEVLTPILAGLGTGANAEPFKTVLKALSSSTEDKAQYLQLRVAPELWLKKLVISGFDKIFEIGPNFRNEGIDLTHSPEFTSCEFYQTFTNLDELMAMTEEIFRELYVALSHSRIPLAVSHLDSLSALREGSFPKYEFIPTLEERTGVQLPQNLTSEELIAYHKKIGLKLPTVLSPSSLLDHLSSVYLESLSNDSSTPIFLYNQPAALSPLAKSTLLSYGDRTYEISLRFELFIRGKEYVNSYEEENSPFEQARKFIAQKNNNVEYKDDEQLIPDWPYINLLEYGLPPTGGWGCGIDRLCMMFSGSSRIEQVLSFGSIKDVLKQ